MKDRKMKDRKTDPNTQVLRRQAIDASGPGSILRDFETLLEFIGAEGLRARGSTISCPWNGSANWTRR